LLKEIQLERKKLLKPLIRPQEFSKTI